MTHIHKHSGIRQSHQSQLPIPNAARCDRVLTLTAASIDIVSDDAIYSVALKAFAILSRSYEKTRCRLWTQTV